MPDARCHPTPAPATPKLAVAPPAPEASGPSSPAAPSSAAGGAAGVTEEEHELCKRIANGDEAAFETIVLRYQDRVFSFCLRFLGDRAEAEDVAQDVFLTLYRSAQEFRAESAFSTWLLRIAKNQSLNRIKYLDRRGRTGRRSIEEVSDARLTKTPGGEADKTPDELVEGGETAKLVQNAIATLDPQHRDVVVLRDVEDLSYEEISGITGLPIGTVKSRIHRGRSALAQRLERIFR